MNYHGDKKYIYWGLTVFFVFVSCILFYYLLFHGESLKEGIGRVVGIFMPIIDGLVLAYLLNPIHNFLEKMVIGLLYHRFHMDTLQNKKKFRTFSIIGTVIFFLLIVYGFIMLVIPQIIQSIQNIVVQFPSYVSNLENWIESILANNRQIEKTATELINRYSSELETWMNETLMPQINVLIRQVSLSVLGFAKFLWNIIIGLIISFFVQPRRAV